MNDILNNLAANLAAMIIIFALGFASRVLLTRWRERRSSIISRQRLEQTLPKYTSRWLVSYYLSRGKEDDLFSVTKNGLHRYIPILTRAIWHESPLSETELIDKPEKLLKSTVKLDHKVLATRRAYMRARGENIWNDPILCATSITTQNNKPRISVGYADYYQYLSSCGKLEDETYSAIERGRQDTPLRNQHACDLAKLSKCSLGAHGIGMQAVVAFREGNSFKFLLQRRVAGLAIYGGSLAVIPTFACEPSGPDPSDSEVSLFHNFLREFYEELYSSTEVERPTKHVDPHWFYDVLPISDLLNLQQKGKFVFEILGVGFEALNAEVNIAALALILDETFMKRQIKKMQANWEVKRILIEEMDSDQIWRWILDYEFQPGSAYALVKAMQRINAYYRQDSRPARRKN